MDIGDHKVLFWSLGIFLVALIIVGAFFTVQKISNKNLTKKDLQQEAETIQATIQEGVLLSEVSSSDKTTPEFTQTHAEDLNKQLQSSQKKLTSSPADSEIKGELAAQIILLKQAQNRLQPLQDFSGDLPDALQIKQQLQNISQQEKELEDSL